MFNSLRIRLTLLFVGITIIPLVLVSVLIAQQGFNTLQNQALAMQEQIAHRAATALAAFFDERRNELLVLTNVYGLDYLDRGTQKDILATLLSQQSTYYELALMDSRGEEQIRLSRNETFTNNELVSRADDPQFQVAVQTGMTSFSSVFFDETARDRLVTLAIPIEDLFTGEINHVLMAELRFQMIEESGLREFDLDAGDDIYVTLPDGLIVSHRNPSLVLRETVFNLPEADGRYTGLDGDDVVVSTHPFDIDGLNLIVVAESAYAKATALAFDLTELATIIPLISLVIAGGIVIWAVSRVVNPIVRMAQVARVVQKSDFSATADETGEDEIAQLGRAFNRMTAQLQTFIREEQEKKAYLENTLVNYAAFIDDVAHGDLTQSLHLNGGLTDEDDLYQLGFNLNVMVANRHTMAQQIREVGVEITASAAEIQAASAQQTASAAEQDAAVTQTVATVEEVQATVQQTAERAQAVAQSSQQSIVISREGLDAVTATRDGMQRIRQQVDDIARTILMLSERTQQIGEIIETVNAIADQSKLLALNASIEAARAGEEGRGFAVVAMEVRQLAEQSREATARVSNILHEIQQATNEAVMVTEQGSKGTAVGMALVDQAGTAIRQLAQTIEDAAAAATQIAASTHQQTNGMSQLGMAMTQIKQTSTQTTSAMEQTNHSIENLMAMAHQMEVAVAQYELLMVEQERRFEAAEAAT
jgi:methyl-accepting chemotaxis protein